MAVPKKRRSKSKKKFRKQCWKKKAEIQTQKAYSIYKLISKEKKNSEKSINSVENSNK